MSKISVKYEGRLVTVPLGESEDGRSRLFVGDSPPVLGDLKEKDVFIALGEFTDDDPGDPGGSIDISDKVNRSELTSVITDVTYGTGETNVEVTLSTYNAETKTSSSLKRNIPIVSNVEAGIMLPETYSALETAVNDIISLKAQGGRFIGISFATAAELQQFTIPEYVNPNDFTYVLSDETHNGAQTMWVVTKTDDVKHFVFARISEELAVGIGTLTQPGLVKSSTTAGKVFIEADASMSVMGWDAVQADISTINSQIDAINITTMLNSLPTLA